MNKTRGPTRRHPAAVRAAVLLSLLALAAFRGPAETATHAQGFFWSVQSDSATVYLYGSVHVGKPDFYPLPDAVESTFAAADQLAVEADIRPASQTAAVPAYLAAALLPAETTLREQLPEPIRTLLDAYLEESGPVMRMTIDRMRPWAAAVTIALQEIRKTGYDPEWGVDLYFLNKAQAAGKTIVELESVEKQLTLFAALDDAVQKHMLKNVLRERNAIAGDTERMIQSWKAGDGETLQRKFMQQFADEEIMAPLKKALLTERDAAMTETIGRFLEGTETVFVVVGAAHLIGEEGIPARLARNPDLTVIRKE